MQSQIFDLCIRKCLSSLSILNKQVLQIPQKSCFNRCQIKYSQAYNYTKDYLNYQNYHVNKMQQEHLKSLQNSQVGFLDKLHSIYEENMNKQQYNNNNSNNNKGSL